MKTIYFVRHGESEANAGGIIQGGSKTPLSERGEKQAAFVGERCSKLSIDAIIASPFLRTRQTAELIAEHVNLPIEYSDLFVEWDRGSFRIGKRANDPAIKQTEMDLITHLCEQDRRLADEENFNDLNKRAEAALTFLEKRPESHILVVGHGLFVRILIGRAVLGKDYTGRDCEHFIKTFRTTNTGITILQYQPEDAWGPWRVLAWNDHAHLG